MDITELLRPHIWRPANLPCSPTIEGPYYAGIRIEYQYSGINGIPSKEVSLAAKQMEAVLRVITGEEVLPGHFFHKPRDVATVSKFLVSNLKRGHGCKWDM